MNTKPPPISNELVAEIDWLKRTVENQAQGITFLQSELASARDQIASMKSSRFWQLRELYWRLRGKASFLRPKSQSPLPAPGISQPTAQITPVAQAGLQNAKPLFIVGPPRTGTTFLARALNAHPQLLMTNETAAFFMLGYDIQGSRKGYSAGILFGKSYHNLWADHLTTNARSLLEGFYTSICLAEGKNNVNYWGEKHPSNYACLSFIDVLYPSARYIYTIRDPRDTICSIAEMNQINFAEALNLYAPYIEAYENFWDTQGKSIARISVHYEDLARDPGAAVGQILEWLNLDYASEIKAFLSTYRNRRADIPEGDEPSGIDFPSKSIGRWRRETDPVEVATLGPAIEGYMKRHAYT